MVTNPYIAKLLIEAHTDDLRRAAGGASPARTTNDEDSQSACSRRSRACGTRWRATAIPRGRGRDLADPFVGAVERAMQFPGNALEFTNILLTTDDAVVGATPRDVVWTHRETTLYRYRSSKRRYRVPLLLVFALIKRPEIFDLHPGRSLVEFLIDEGFDVFLVDWGYPDEEDADMGLDEYVCDELEWAVRETAGQRRRGAVADGLVHRRDAVRDVLRPRPRRRAVGAGPSKEHPGPADDADRRAPLDLRQLGRRRGLRHRRSERALWLASGSAIDFANKMMKPVTNYWTTYRRLWDGVQDGTTRRESYQTMAKWVADNPPFPAGHGRSGFASCIETRRC